MNLPNFINFSGFLYNIYNNFFFKVLVKFFARKARTG